MNTAKVRVGNAMKARSAVKDGNGLTLKDRLRKALDESQYEGGSELARAIGYTPASVSDWLTGKTKSMKGETATKAARVLQVSPLWLSTGEGPMRPPSAAPAAAPVAGRAPLSPKMVAEVALAMRLHAHRKGYDFDITTEAGATDFVYWYEMREVLPDAVALSNVIDLDSRRQSAPNPGKASDRHGNGASSHGAHGRKR